MTKDQILIEGEFNPKVRQYWMLSITFLMLITIIGIPLLIIWLPLGGYFTKKYLSRLECRLTSRNLIVKGGLLVRQEKTIPLEKITDLGMVQGPIMRMYDIHSLSIETAGQSGTGALANLTGLIDVENFREQVLAQRDRISLSQESAQRTQEADGSKDTEELLEKILETLQRIEANLKDR